MNTKMKVLSLAIVGLFGFAGSALAACPAGPTTVDVFSAQKNNARIDPNFYRIIEITSNVNTNYNAKFGHPFILAVRGHTRSSIIDALETRENNSADAEFAEALHQIEKIALFRLEELFRADH